MHGVTEQIEHASHETRRLGQLARLIGLTTALLSILMAYCSAQVGMARTELIATMVEETAATLRYQTVSSKYRMIQAHLQQLHALLPDPKLFQKLEGEIKQLESQIKNAETAQVVKVVRLETRKILDSVMPSREDMERFAKSIRRYRIEMETAKKWSESYKDAIKVHTLTASRMEMAQMVTEIGIILTSLGLLIGKLLWYARGALISGIVLGVISLCIAGGTKFANQSEVHHAEEKIAQTRKQYVDLVKDDDNAAEDEQLLKAIESDLEKLGP